jgi:hypothetical protein
MWEADGRVLELRLSGEGRPAALIECPTDLLPAAGQYLLGRAAHDEETALPSALFRSAGRVEQRHGGKIAFQTAPEMPESWAPGKALALDGPKGRGFSPPSAIKRLALAALGDTAERLLALLGKGVDTVLYCDLALPSLPAWVELLPTKDLADGLHWADYLALDLPAEKLPELPGLLGSRGFVEQSCPAQVLVHTDMPCGGVAECGICAICAGMGWKLACVDGPVFDLASLTS